MNRNYISILKNITLSFVDRAGVQFLYKPYSILTSVSRAHLTAFSFKLNVL
jgi:hypothetical protein